MTRHKTGLTHRFTINFLETEAEELSKQALAWGTSVGFIVRYRLGYIQRDNSETGGKEP